MEERILRLPPDPAELARLELGQIVYAEGSLITGRDKAHGKMVEALEKGEPLPVELRGQALWHCGPLVREQEGQYTILSAGSTTSMRLESVEARLIEALGFLVIIGKGGMGAKTAAALAKVGGVYLASVGGTGALLGSAIVALRGMHWKELGVAEAVWELEVRGLGPLIVAIDSRGNNLHDQRRRETAQRLERYLSRARG